VKAVPFAGLRHLPDIDQPASLKKWLKHYSVFWCLDGMDPLPIGPGKTLRPQGPGRRWSGLGQAAYQRLLGMTDGITPARAPDTGQ